MVPLCGSGGGQGLALPLLVSIAAAGWLAVTYVLLGDMLLRHIGRYTATPFERLVLGAGLGFGCIGNIVTLLNFLHLAYPIVIVSVLVAFTLPVVIIRIWHHRNFQWFKPSRCTGENLLLYGPLIALFGLYFLRSLLPPVGFDALMYHLSCARLFLENHGFYDIYFNPQSDYPMLSEMQYQIGLALGNDRICRLIDFFAGLVACGTIALFSFRSGLGRKGAVAGCMIFLTMTVVIAAYTNCDVDIAMAAWTGLAVYAAMKARDEQSTGLAIVAALFAGMALQTKIFGVFALLPVVIAAGAYRPSAWKRLPLLAGIPLLMALPWYVKALRYTGSILSINRHVIEGQGLGLPMGAGVDSPVISFLIHVPLRILAAPWTFSLMPSQHQQDTLGPFFLMLLPFALLLKSSRRPFSLLLAGLPYLAEVLAMELLFIPGGASIRYTLPAVLLLIPAGVVLLRELRRQYPAVGKVIGVLVAVQICCGGVLLVKRHHRDWMALLLGKDRVAYYESILPQYPAVNFINASSEVTGILTTHNYDNYLINKPYVAAFKHYSSAQACVAELKRLGISHVLANNHFDTLANRTAFSFLEGIHTVFHQNGIYVFDVTPVTGENIPGDGVDITSSGN